MARFGSLVPAASLQIGALRGLGQDIQQAGAAIGQARQRAGLMAMQRQQLAVQERQLRQEQEQVDFNNALKIHGILTDAGNWDAADRLFNERLVPLSNNIFKPVEPGANPDMTKQIGKIGKNFLAGKIDKVPFGKSVNLVQRTSPRQQKLLKQQLETTKLAQDILQPQREREQRERLAQTISGFQQRQQGMVAGPQPTGEVERQLRLQAQPGIPELSAELARAGQLGQLKQFVPEVPKPVKENPKQAITRLEIANRDPNITSAQKTINQDIIDALKPFAKTEVRIAGLPKKLADIKATTRNQKKAIIRFKNPDMSDQEVEDMADLMEAASDPDSPLAKKEGAIRSLLKSIGLGFLFDGDETEPPPQAGKQLTPNDAARFLREANGDPIRARELATAEGFDVPPPPKQ